MFLGAGDEHGALLGQTTAHSVAARVIEHRLIGNAGGLKSGETPPSGPVRGQLVSVGRGGTTGSGQGRDARHGAEQAVTARDVDRMPDEGQQDQGGHRCGEQHAQGDEAIAHRAMIERQDIAGQDTPHRDKGQERGRRRQQRVGGGERDIAEHEDQHDDKNDARGPIPSACMPFHDLVPLPTHTSSANVPTTSVTLASTSIP